jgi:7-cyano-7-deazaguanine synthase
MRKIYQIPQLSGISGSACRPPLRRNTAASVVGPRPPLKKHPAIGALVSGGLDSAAMLAHLAKDCPRVVPLYIRCGLHWEKTELYWARRFIQRLANPRISALVVLNLPLVDTYGRHWSVTGKKVPGYRSADQEFFLPARNLFLISKAAVYLSLRGIHGLALGSLATNPFPDAQKHYFQKLTQILSQSLACPFRLSTPLGRDQKWQVIKRFTRLPLEFTFSCADPVGKLHCGRCNKCAERKRAFQKAGFSDSTRYSSR